MKILITGGAGYVGTALVVRLLQNEQVDEIIIYDNLSRPNYNLFLGHTMQERSANPSVRIQFVQGELLDTRKLKGHLREADVVYHLAAKVVTPFATTDGHMYEQINHWGTAELVYAVEELDNIQKVVYTSSTSVYGAAHAGEDSLPDPQTIYGFSKLRGEEHVRRLFDQKQTCIIRCGNVYGYNRSMRFDAVINRFMFEANFNRRISIHGNGRQRRAFVHVETVAEVLAQLLDSDLPSDTYNLVEKNLQVLDIVDDLKAIFPDLEFIFINQHMMLRDMTVDTQLKLDHYIEKRQETSLREALEDFKKRFSF